MEVQCASQKVIGMSPIWSKTSLFFFLVINPRRACAARVTVVVLCVCVCVCVQLFSDYRLRGGL